MARARLPLLGGPYQARSLIAGAQRCVNLYPEINPQEGQPPVPVTHYLTPGLELLGTPPALLASRCIYLASNGEVFAVVGGGVYFIDANYTFTLLGNIPFTEPTTCYMADNGEHGGDALVLVDGSTTGYVIQLSTHSFGTIGSGFLGATKVEYIDTFFIFNEPGTPNFYISLSNATYADFIAGTAFDPLDIAAKTGGSDPLATILALRGELWLIGTLTSEVFANTGAAEFPFERIPGSLMEHGCVAPYSIAKADVSGYFLMQDRQGRGIVVQTVGYGLQRISTHAIEQAIQGYGRIDDAIGYTRQEEGHGFYVLHFPTADKTWVVELSTRQWHEWESMDGNGVPHRHRVAYYTAGYSKNLGLDYQSGKLYNLDRETYTDNGTPIRRLRSFPHLVTDGGFNEYKFFQADVEVGQIEGVMVPENPEDADESTLIFLRWSDDRGVTYGTPIAQTLGATGQYLVRPKWSNLGSAYDRVFELSWSCPAKTALQGAFISAQPAPQSA